MQHSTQTNTRETRRSWPSMCAHKSGVKGCIRSSHNPLNLLPVAQVVAREGESTATHPAQVCGWIKVGIAKASSPQCLGQYSWAIMKGELKYARERDGIPYFSLEQRGSSDWSMTLSHNSVLVLLLVLYNCMLLYLGHVATCQPNPFCIIYFLIWNQI